MAEYQRIQKLHNQNRGGSHRAVRLRPRRQGQRRRARSDRGRLLRHSHPHPPDRVHFQPRCAHAAHPAVGRQHAQAHRKGDPHLRARHQPAERRARHPSCVPAAHRGAPQGARQAGASKYGEEAKVAVRNIRRDAMDKFKKEQKKARDHRGRPEGSSKRTCRS